MYNLCNTDEGVDKQHSINYALTLRFLQKKYCFSGVVGFSSSRLVLKNIMLCSFLDIKIGINKKQLRFALAVVVEVKKTDEDMQLQSILYHQKVCRRGEREPNE